MGYIKNSLKSVMGVLRGKEVAHVTNRLNKHQAQFERLSRAATPDKSGATLNKYYDKRKALESQLANAKRRRFAAGAGVTGAGYYGIYKGIDHAERATAEANGMPIQEDAPMFNYGAMKFASLGEPNDPVDDNRTNIPPMSTASTKPDPADLFDYYDYQELTNSEGNQNMPDRNDLPVLDNNPFKTAAAIDADLEVTTAMHEYLRVNDPEYNEKIAGIKDYIKKGTDYIKSFTKKEVKGNPGAANRLRSGHYNGSRFVGAALLSGGVGAGLYGATRLAKKEWDLKHDYAK